MSILAPIDQQIQHPSTSVAHSADYSHCESSTCTVAGKGENLPVVATAMSVTPSPLKSPAMMALVRGSLVPWR